MKFLTPLHRIWKYFENATTARVFGVAFLISILAGLGASLQSRTIIGGEGHDGYLELAKNLVAGNGYVFTPGGHKVFHRPPAYSTLLIPGAALPRRLTLAYIIFLNSALLAGTVALLFQFTTVHLNRRIGLAASAFLLLNPFLLYGVKNPVSAICQMFLYSLVLAVAWRITHCRTVTFRDLFSQLFVLWAAALSHGVMLPLTLLLLGTLLIRSIATKIGPTPPQILSLLVGLLVLIAPWTWRNYKVTGRFIPVAGNAGLAYFAGNAHWGITEPPRRFDEYREDSEFRHAGLPIKERREVMTYYGFTDPATDKLVTERAKQHIRAHPADFAKKFGLNALEYYFPIIFAIIPPSGSYLEGLNLVQRFEASHPEALPMSLYHGALIMSAILGFATLWRRSPGLAVALLGAWWIYAFSYFPFLTFVGHSLYIYGTLPVISLLAATFWARERKVNV